MEEISSGFTTKLLSEATWPDFAGLVERHNGIWGGCWCMSFHVARESDLKKETASQRRQSKEQLVIQGHAHAALVYNSSECIGWCQYGRTSELPRIDSRKRYAGDTSDRPEWRITCFFVARNQRRKGVAIAALKRALQEISMSGGGLVEAYPFDFSNRPHSGSFNWGGTVSMFEREGFLQLRKIAPSQWVMSKFVAGERRSRVPPCAQGRHSG